MHEAKQESLAAYKLQQQKDKINAVSLFEPEEVKEEEDYPVDQDKRAHTESEESEDVQAVEMSPGKNKKKVHFEAEQQNEEDGPRPAIVAYEQQSEITQSNPNLLDAGTGSPEQHKQSKESD